MAVTVKTYEHTPHLPPPANAFPCSVKYSNWMNVPALFLGAVYEYIL